MFKGLGVEVRDVVGMNMGGEAPGLEIKRGLKCCAVWNCTSGGGGVATVTGLWVSWQLEAQQWGVHRATSRTDECAVAARVAVCDMCVSNS